MCIQPCSGMKISKENAALDITIPKWNATYRTQVLRKLPLFILKTVLNATNRDSMCQDLGQCK